jgi:hypothetical protein
MARRAPSASTPRSCVPSLLNVTFSILSALTSLRKSLYRTSAGPYALACTTGRSPLLGGGGGASIMAAMLSRDDDDDDDEAPAAVAVAGR